MNKLLCYLGIHRWEEYIREKQYSSNRIAIINHHRYCKKCDTWEEIFGNYGGSWWERITEIKNLDGLKKI